MAEDRQVFVRPVDVRDQEALITAVQRSRHLHGDWVSPPDTPEAFTTYLERVSKPTHVGLVIIEEETQDIVGVVNINEIVRGFFQSAYLGYYALDPWAGKGLMKQGMQRAMEYAFETLDLHRLESNIQPENTASIALVTSLGFRNEGFSPRYLKIAGVWRDHQRWAITREEFRY